jgi:hypothetical protein
VGNTSVSVTVPAGTPGQPVAVVLLHDTVPGPAATGVRYGAVITRNSVPAAYRTGWTTTLTGVGFARSGGWVLVSSTGKVVASLPVVATQKALSGVRSGVWIGSATSVVAKLPGLAAGTYSLRFLPSSAAYPGAVFLGTGPATVVYR